MLLQLTERYGESAQTGAEYEMTGAEDLAILRTLPAGLRRPFSYRSLKRIRRPSVKADPRLLLRALLRQHFNAFVEKTFATLAPG